MRKLKEGAVVADLYGFLTTEAKATVCEVHPKAMPVILTKPEDWETWLTAPFDEAKVLQQPLPDDVLEVVPAGERTNLAELGCLVGPEQFDQAATARFP